MVHWVAQLAADGLAEWELLGNGDILLRLSSGEAYLLAAFTIQRLA